MTENLFELLGISDPEVKPKPDDPSTPAPPRSSMLMPPEPARLGLHSFLTQRYPIRSYQHRKFSSTPIQVDDRKPTDCSNNFCDISVTVPIGTSNGFTLELINPPWNDEVRALVRDYHGQWFDEVAATRIVANVRLKQHGFMRKLAQAIRKVVSVRHVKRTGQRYAIRDWRWVARRASASLEGLADSIWEFRKQHANVAVKAEEGVRK